jgi:hypothetical protein
MPLHPAAQHLIRKVEELSGIPVHVAVNPELKVMASMRRALVMRNYQRPE